MNKILKKVGKHWILIWLIVASLALSIIVSAKYLDEKSKVKRVAANVTENGQMFSSNYLHSGKIELKNIPFTTGKEGFCVIPVTIYNYSESNPSKAYQADLTYTLTAKLVNKSDLIISENALNGLQVGISDDGTNYRTFSTLGWNSEEGCYYTEFTKTFSQKNALGTYIPDVHNYYVRFPDSVLTSESGVYVELIATPSDTKDFTSISVILGAQAQSGVLPRGWTGSFYDDASYTNYDAFNYVITGNGEAKLTFSWCTNFLEVNKVNLTEYGLNAESETKTINGITGIWKTVTIEADPDEEDDDGNVIGLNRYDFQLYMTGDPDTEYGKDDTFWSTVAKYVDFSAG